MQKTQYEQELKAYADLVIEEGIKLYPGQSIHMKTGPATYYFARMLAQSAYAHQARYVHIAVEDLELVRSRLEHYQGKQAPAFPKYIAQAHQEFLDEDWAYIRIEDVDQENTLKDIAAPLVSSYYTSLHRLNHTLKTSLMNSEHPWCVVCAPSEGWSKRVLGPTATPEQLWEVIRPILRMDTEDPARALRSHGDTLLQRCGRLDRMELDALHIEDEGTDLTIGLTTYARWVGGPDKLKDGRYIFCNIPTEEVFTVPDRSRTEGTVKLTMPVSILDSMVEGVTLTFSQGKVTSYTAEKNLDVLEHFLQIDEGASYLGEIALVDCSSPIWKSGRQFFSTLYDENASCHIALGAGYSGCLVNADSVKTETDKRKVQCNVSMEHTDVMFGSPHTHITGKNRNGDTFEIMSEGMLLV